MILFDFFQKWKYFELSTIENLINKKIRVVKRLKASHLKIVSLYCPKKGTILKTIF